MLAPTPKPKRATSKSPLGRIWSKNDRKRREDGHDLDADPPKLSLRRARPCACLDTRPRLPSRSGAKAACRRRSRCRPGPGGSPLARAGAAPEQVGSGSRSSSAGSRGCSEGRRSCRPAYAPRARARERSDRPCDHDAVDPVGECLPDKPDPAARDCPLAPLPDSDLLDRPLTGRSRTLIPGVCCWRNSATASLSSAGLGSIMSISPLRNASATSS